MAELASHLDLANAHRAKTGHGTVTPEREATFYRAQHEVKDGGMTNWVDVEVKYTSTPSGFKSIVRAQPAYDKTYSSLSNKASVKFELKSGFPVSTPKIAGEKDMKIWPGLMNAVQRVATEHATRAVQLFNETHRH
ncbi:Uncharacterised protein [uncultured archaeon]|nr:Uncharacterised protein [uncultured archaeon]